MRAALTYPRLYRRGDAPIAIPASPGRWRVWAAPRLAQLGAQVYAALFTAATVLIVMEGLAGALTRSPA